MYVQPPAVVPQSNGIKSPPEGGGRYQRCSCCRGAGIGCAKSGASCIAEAVLLGFGRIPCLFADGAKVHVLRCCCCCCWALERDAIFPGTGTKELALSHECQWTRSVCRTAVAQRRQGHCTLGEGAMRPQGCWPNAPRQPLFTNRIIFETKHVSCIQGCCALVRYLKPGIRNQDSLFYVRSKFSGQAQAASRVQPPPVQAIASIHHPPSRIVSFSFVCMIPCRSSTSTSHPPALSTLKTPRSMEHTQHGSPAVYWAVQQ